jgi:hypothetical protein
MSVSTVEHVYDVVVNGMCLASFCNKYEAHRYAVAYASNYAGSNVQVIYNGK